MKIKTYIWIIVFMCLVAVASGQPPFVQESGTNTMLEVVVPKIEYFDISSTNVFNIHAFNSTGHIVTNETGSCHIHIFNSTGGHIFEQDMNFEDNDFYVNLNNSFTTTKNLVPYIVQCNTSYEGGFFSGTFEVNDESLYFKNDLDSTAGISIVVFILFATLLFFFLPRIVEKFSENMFADMVIRRGCWIIGMFLMVMNSAVVAGISNAAGYGTQELFRYLWLFGQGGYLLMFTTGIKTLFDIVKLYKMKKEKERME